jgi:ubiquinone biosynthesis protein Coq4
MGFKYLDKLTDKEDIKKFLDFVDLAAGSGQDVNNVFNMSEKFNQSIPMQRCLKALRKNPSSARMLDEKYVGPLYDLETMLKMPKGSLGWTYAKIMSTLGYDPQFYPRPKTFPNDAAYVSFRVYKTHDIQHILTGFSLDNLGEIGVISLSVAQFGYPTFIFLDLMGLMFSFFESDQLYEEELEMTEAGRTLGYKFTVMNKGLEMGEAARPLFPIKWEEGLERPIEEWREELNIKPVTEGFYSWYSRPELAAAIS